MARRCANLECWSEPIGIDDDFCTECLHPTICAEDLFVESNTPLPNSIAAFSDEPLQDPMSSLIGSFPCEPPSQSVSTGLEIPDTLVAANGETTPALVPPNTKQPAQSVYNQPSSSGTLPFLHYDPQAGESGKHKTKRSCTSCYNKRKCETEEGQTSCKNCVGKSVYCKGPIITPQLIVAQSWSSTAIASSASTSMSLDAILIKNPTFCLQVSLDDSMPSSPKAKKEIQASSFAAEPVCKSYIIDLRGLRDNAPTCGDTLTLDQILDMIFPDVNRTTSNNSNTGPDGLTSYERDCRRFLACIMPLRIPQLCMVGSKLWKDPASSYIMFEFLRQLGQKACSLFGKIFEDLTAFLDSPRNKKQFSKQLSFVAFNLGLISQGVEALGRGQDEWSKLLRLPNLYAVAPSALTQLKFLGRSFDAASFTAGCDDKQGNLPSIHITLASTKEQSVSQATDKRYSFLEVLAQHGNLLDGTAAVDPSRTNLTEKLTREQQVLKDQIELEISDLRMQIEAEKRRHVMRMTQLERECRAKLHFAQEPDLSNASIETATSRQISKKKYAEMDSSLMYSKPQPSPISDVTTLVEPSDASSPEGPANSNPSDAELELDMAIDREHPQDVQLLVPGGNERSAPKALAESLVTTRLHKDSTHEFDSFRSKSLSKRKRLSGYLSLKKQRLEANPKSENEEEVIVDNSPVVKSTSGKFNLLGSAGELGDIEMSSDSTDKDTMRQDPKLDDPNAASINQVSSLSGQLVRTRPPRMPAGRVLAVQGKKVSCNDTINQILLTDSDRPTSWPRSRRWRKSIGYSVKALTDGFERLAMAKGVHSLAE